MATVTIKNIGRLTQRLNKIAEIDITGKVNRATAIVHGQAKELAPSNKYTNGGVLKNSIHMEVKKYKDKIQGRVYTNVEYAPFVEFGTGIAGNGSYPYEVKGLSLSYRSTPWVYTPDDGETFYRTEGQVAQPYMYPALKFHKKTIKNILNEGVRTELKRNCKGG